MKLEDILQAAITQSKVQIGKPFRASVWLSCEHKHFHEFKDILVPSGDYGVRLVNSSAGDVSVSFIASIDISIPEVSWMGVKPTQIELLAIAGSMDELKQLLGLED